MGVIAQEVEAVIPALVHVRADGYREVDYGGLVVELLAAIVELDTRLADLNSASAPEPPAASACELIGRLSPGEPIGDGRRALDRKLVAEVFPAIVRADEHGDDQISYHPLVAPLIEAVKELDARLTIAEAARPGTSDPSLER